jgi:ATP-binding cassette subfamily B protein
MLTWPITALGWIASLVQQASASQERINEFMLVESSILDSEEPKIPLSWDIEFENVSFTYPETKTLALDNVSFKLNDGAKMAIMGRTASGKSTIAELLVRMYDIDSGTIRIGGINIKDISLETLRKKLAYVPQDVFLFSDTIADNINFGLTQEEPLDTVKKYASFASIHEDIMDLPKQFETFVGERGVTLSGGQKQRISLARALIKNPSCIVLDDCLSAVDATTENNIVKHFNTGLANKTTLVITHRVHSQMDYDKILVIEKGKIAEFGTHNELIKNKSLYFDMFQQQSLDEVDHLN